MKVSIKAQLCELLIKESFGEVLAKIVGYIARKPKTPLRLISQDTKIGLKKIKTALAVGVQHNFITKTTHKRGFIQYSVDIDEILHRTRYPSYIYCAKMLYGYIGEVLVEELLHLGQALHKSLIDRVMAKINKALSDKTSKSQVEDKLDLLLNSGFVEICEDESKAADEQVETSPPAKRQKTDSSNKDDVCYKVYHKRFDYYQRDQIMIEAVSHKLSPTHGGILACMLRLSEVRTNPGNLESFLLSANEIFNALPKDLGITSKAVLDVYLLTLTDDEMGFVMKADDSGGGSYIINFQEAMTSLCKSHMEAVVLERFGSKSLRLFRLLLLKQHMEQKQMEDIAMIPSKMVKELLYTMFTQKFVSVTEVAKSSDHAPSRTFYCFKVPMEQLSRQLLDWNYKSILNMMMKRANVLTKNKRLLDKQQRTEAILATMTSMTEEQKQEIEEMITPAERNQLRAVQLQTDKLETAELHLASTTLVWELYISYCIAKRTM